MKTAVFLVSFVVFFVMFASVVQAGDVLDFKAKIGFDKDQDRIVEHRFFENGSKVLLIGEKTLQIWDVENAKLLSSTPHNIPQFATRGIFNTLLLGLPELFSWKPYLIDPNGKWIVTIESAADKKSKSAIVRDLQNIKQIAVLDLPNTSTDYVLFDEDKDDIITYGKDDKNVSFANWDSDDFQLKRVIKINDYKSSQFLDNEEKMIVGSGDTKITWNGTAMKDGDNLTLRDVKTGAIEKEYTAKNLIPETTYTGTTISAGEKYLLSIRNKRIFVWEINGDGQPLFEISAQMPKQNVELKTIIAGRYLVVAIDKKLAVYDFGGSGKPRYELVSDKLNDSVTLDDVTGSGKFMVVSDDDKSSVLETGGDGKPLYKIVRTSEKERLRSSFMSNENYLLVWRANRSEKQPDRTEFYDIASGKKSFEIPAVINSRAILTPDRKYIYEQNLGYTFVWNFAENKSFKIPLKVYTPDSSSNPFYFQLNLPYNIENTALSPDGKLILKYGKNLVSVFDIATGEIVQSLFDADNVKYDKNKKIKDSGLGDAGWSEDGKTAYAFDENGFFGRRRKINFWNVKN